MRRVKIVNFGSRYGGLTTVGYTLYKKDGSVHTARTTSGIVEIGTNTGIYACEIDFPSEEDLIILWDTGGVSPRYATEEYCVQLSNIQEETDKIRIIWNTLKNRFDYEGEILTKLRQLTKKEQIKKSDIAKLIKGIPIRDYTKEFTQLHQLFKGIDLDPIVKKVTTIEKRKIDLTPILKKIDEMREMLEESLNKINNIKMPELPRYDDRFSAIEEIVKGIDIPQYDEKLNELNRRISLIKIPDVKGDIETTKEKLLLQLEEFKELIVEDFKKKLLGQLNTIRKYIDQINPDIKKRKEDLYKKLLLLGGR